MKLLMCEPQYYTVSYEINPWMNKTCHVDTALAQRQWHALYDTILKCGAEVAIMPSHPEWPDIVFTANAGLVRDKKVMLSHFKFPERQGERVYYQAWFADNGYDIIADKPEDFHHDEYPGPCFEGAGDALFAGDRLFAGFGYRSDSDVYRRLAPMDVHEIIYCELVDPHFYHLDTCFCPLNDKLALWWPGAFSQSCQQKIHNSIELLRVPEKEAQKFACNAVVIDKHIIIPWGCPETQEMLEKLGYKVHDCDMSEFIKAGGACKCLTLAL